MALKLSVGMKLVIELLDDNTIRVLREHGGMELPDVMAMILVETDGYTEEEAAF